MRLSEYDRNYNLAHTQIEYPERRTCLDFTEYLQRHILNRTMYRKRDGQKGGEFAVKRCRFYEHGHNACVLRTVTLSRGLRDSVTVNEEAKYNGDGNHNIERERDSQIWHDNVCSGRGLGLRFGRCDLDKRKNSKD